MKREAGPVRIVCDDRERRGKLFGVLQERDDVVVDVVRLACGDYVVEERVTVERKAGADLLGSLASGRLFRQAAALKRRAERPVLLIEGEMSRRRHRQPPDVRGALVSLSVMWYLPVLWAFDEIEAAQLLVAIGRQWTRDRTETWMPPPFARRRAADQRERLLCNVPGVGPHLARELLAHFGSIQALCNASPRDLARVRGIGGRRATSIRRLLGNDPSAGCVRERAAPPFDVVFHAAARDSVFRWR